MSPKQTPTLATLAQIAGVSPATVSRALRGHPALSAATIRRVQRIARREGYRPNFLVSSVMRQFRSGRSAAARGNIGYLTFGSEAGAWRKHLTFVGFFEAARARAQELGYSLDEVWADEPGLNSARLRKVLLARGITGVIVGPTPGLPHAPHLAWEEFTPVKIGVPFPDLSMPCVVSNQYHAMQQVIEKLRGYGYRRLGLVLQSHQNIKTAGLWLAPFSYYEHHVRPAERVAPLVMENWSRCDFINWFQTHRPEVIIGLRRELIDWLLQLDLHVPRDVGFVHLDSSTEPGSFAGVDQHPEEIGAAALDLLSGRLLSNERGLPATQRLLLIDGVWTDGPTIKRKR